MFTTKRVASVGLVLALMFAPLGACGGGKGSGPGAGGPPAETPHPPIVSASPSPSPSPSPPLTSPAPAPDRPPAGGVVSARVAYRWNWPNDAVRPGRVHHDYRVPPVPELVAVGVGDHPRDPGERPYNRMSFTFNTGFPSYRFEFADKLYGDATGEVIPLRGLGVLVVRFEVARAHSADGTHSTIVSKPPPTFGYTRMVSWAQAGDHEGVLTYGIGITWPVPHSNPQIAVRAYEVAKVTPLGQHRYVVAIDVDAR